MARVVGWALALQARALALCCLCLGGVLNAQREGVRVVFTSLLEMSVHKSVQKGLEWLRLACVPWMLERGCEAADLWVLV